MTKKIDYSRREFIKNASFLSAAGSIGAPFALNLFAMNVAAAAAIPYTSGDYKALVCLYLGGGNDHNNTVIATDSASLQGYTAARGQTGSTIALGAALADFASTALTPTFATKTNNFNTPASATNDNSSRSFALHPQLTKLTARFNAVKSGTPLPGMQAAIIANVGTLVTPIHNLTDYHNNASFPKPVNLFSHSDQTAEWQSTDPLQLSYGWGGRMADIVKSVNAKANFTAISIAGNTAFLAGPNIHQYQISQNGQASAINGLKNLFGAPANSGATLSDIIMPSTSTNMMELDHAAVVQRAITAQDDISKIMTATAPAIAPSAGGPTPVLTIPPYKNAQGNTSASQTANPLALQLQTVARLIAGRGTPGTSLSGTTGASRQVFFVSMGGFDTHNSQATGQAELMARIDHALDYFNSALIQLPGGVDMTPNVTLFTASDFGRTFTSNGDGTDHGWGAHHFVLGGAVKGGDIYGPFPVTAVTSAAKNGFPAFNNPLDVGSGNTIPQISVDQYAATLATWFGVSTGDIATLFPNLHNFANDLSTQSLGGILDFMV